MANLDAVKGQWEEVADGSGVPLSTVKKIGYRETTDPRSGTVEKLSSYFRDNPPKVVQLSQARAS